MYVSSDMLSSSVFLDESAWNWYYFFLKYSVQFSSRVICAWSCLCEKVSTFKFIFFLTVVG